MQKNKKLFKAFIRINIILGIAFFTTCAGHIPEIPYRAPKVAVVLGGGAARGFAHVGVLRVLEEQKIPIHMIVGTSVGSIMGALYADCRSSLELERLAYTIEKEDIFDFSLLEINKKGIVRGDGLVHILEENLSTKMIENFSIPFYAVAVDLHTGERVVFDKGPVVQAVRASSSIPGVFVPVVLSDGRTLVDGGVAGNLAADVAWNKGADIIIAVDISEDVTGTQTDDLLSTTLQSITIMSREIDRHKKNYADVIIRPRVGGISMLDFTQKKVCIAAGAAAIRGKLPSIRRLLAEWDKNYKKPVNKK